MYPLHFDASHATVRLILEYYPDATKSADEEGFLPLHTALYAEAPQEVLSVLLDHYQEAVRKETVGHFSIDESLP